MKKIICFLLTLIMCASLFNVIPVSASAEVWGDAEVATAFAGGTGTADDPYLISNAAQLRYMNVLVNSGATYTYGEEPQNYYEASYKLTADIDLGNTEWTPLGQALPLSWAKEGTKDVITRTPAFQGTFDGANHVIKNAKITKTSTASTAPTSKYVGFFGRAYGATIKNLGLDNIDIQWANSDYAYDTANSKTERTDYYGVFVGAAAITNISDCYVVNSIVKNTNTGINDSGVGGFAGALEFNTNVSNCYAYNVTIQAAKNKTMAGFAGNCLSNNNAVSNSYAAKINVDRDSTFATTYGFMWDGRGDATNTATNCYSTLADAQGTNYASYGYSRKYEPDKSKGKAGVTAETLIDAMLATGAYAQDPAINDGYPYFKVGFDGTPATEYAGGSGTEDDPYLISTPGQLLFATRQVNEGYARSSYFKLTNDIDYGYQPWEPIGYSNQGGNDDFRGGFDGDNHIIKNLTLGTGNYYYCGFFGLVSGATIKNLGIENFQLIRGNVKGSYIRIVGGFIGSARSSTDTKRGSLIENCYVKNSSVHQTRAFSNQSNEEYTDTNLGVFIGVVDIRDYQTQIKNCYVDNVSLYTCIQGEGSGFIAGVTEYNKTNSVSVKLTNCYAANITNAKGETVSQYAFGYTGASSAIFDAEKIILENCYSTYKTQQGTSSSATKLVDGTYFGTEVTDESAIASAFANLEGWQDGTLINDGLPALSWETVPGEPEYRIKSVNKEIMEMNVSGSSGSYNCNLTTDYKVTVNIQRRPDVTGVANVYVAGYDIDGRLTGAKMSAIDKNDFSFTADINGKTAATVKVFVWDDEQTAIIKNPYTAETSIYAPLDEVWSCTGASGGEGGGTAVPTKKTRLVLMGDSIMDSVWNTTDYSWNKYGWEAYIGQYLTDNMTVIKHGHSGQTVKMFIDGRSTYHVCSWDSIKTQFSAGDYVVLALGSNDHNCKCRKKT